MAKMLRGYEDASPRTIFRKCIDTPATVIVGGTEVEICLNKRADNPILLKSGLLYTPLDMPWLESSRKIVITTR
jgi:hypothetical protein